MNDEWLERRAEQLLPDAHLDRLDQYLEGDGSDADRADEAVVREDLRASLRAQLERPVPAELKEAGQALLDLRDRYLSGDKSDEYIETRQAAVGRWNSAWFRASGSGRLLPPSLAGYKFHLLDLPRINLSYADLRSVDGALPSNHEGSNFEGAQLTGANLAGNILARACLKDADLQMTYLVGASLAGADLRNARLDGADLRRADLRKADLSGASLREADLSGAKLHQANLDRADLHFVKGLEPDENSVFQTRFTNRAGIIWKAFLSFYRVLYWLLNKVGLARGLDPVRPEVEDPWSTLRRVYTGPSFFITLLFLVAFVSPYLLQAALLSELSHLESRVVDSVGALLDRDLKGEPMEPEELARLRRSVKEQAESVESTFAEALHSAREAGSRARGLRRPSLEGVDAVRQSVARSAERMESLDSQVRRLKTDLNLVIAGTIQERRYPVWKILLRMDTGQYGWTLLICLLFLYNGLKWFLTTTVAPMRDAEERSHVTPARPEYMVLLPLHRVVSALFWVSLTVGLYTFYQWMTSPVYKLW